TEEAIDAVRVITNHSSGKMGIAIANECKRRGAKVILVAGKVSVSIPDFEKVVRVNSTIEMYNAVMEHYVNADYIVMSAAPSDYRPQMVSKQKIKSDSLTLELVKNPDIAKAVGEAKGDRKLVIFSAETENLIDNARAKLIKKHADMVVANDVTEAGAGFNVDTNKVSIIANDTIINTGVIAKTEASKVIVDNMLKL
ncbi:MAG: phosphopantothenoylcysteine decarboxylase, partial [Clostridia bacterium]|nr:phosphopantothenoylcysteine decarboxylase [Clostridia bacterium]